MGNRNKILMVVGLLVALAIVVLAYLYSNGDLFQGYLRYEYTQPKVNTTLQRLDSGLRVDSPKDDAPGLFGGETVRTQEDGDRLRRP